MSNPRSVQVPPDELFNAIGNNTVNMGALELLVKNNPQNKIYKRLQIYALYSQGEIGKVAQKLKEADKNLFPEQIRVTLKNVGRNTERGNIRLKAYMAELVVPYANKAMKRLASPQK